MSLEDGRATVYEWLQELHLRLQEENDPRDDVVLDVMDYLVGWCAPAARIRG